MFQSDKLYSEIGSRIRCLRKSQDSGMSQEEFAKLLGLSRTSVTNIEAGNQKVPIDTIYILCTQFGLGIESLLPKPDDFAELTDDDPNSINVGGQTHNLGRKTADLLSRVRG